MRKIRIIGYTIASLILLASCSVAVWIVFVIAAKGAP